MHVCCRRQPLILLRAGMLQRKRRRSRYCALFEARQHSMMAPPLDAAAKVLVVLKNMRQG